MRIYFAACVVASALGCGSPAPTSAGAGGSAVDARGSGSSGSSGGTPSSPDAGQGDADAGCPTCSGAIGEDHWVGPFCPQGDAFSAWAAYVACGCAPGGSCAPSCAGDPWCGGVYPVSTAWIDPGAVCSACLASPGFQGCGDQALACQKR